ncbi:hypothetical protein P40081_27545 [Paenibacillus sp. FSL P4-0081]|uniref:methyl-accepting chemotaxis protein n=1 Tax=unclassified Paenibacillus TaxID=185978 RepID=UPI0004F91FA0|nr:methyl-accepting chemotaxis protein [Paenibacillus sp. FSL P4-0081]AIQ31492.1 hypothetical protein P40081_27545 [Paenibacillus sp. FSL P4-0081]
MTRLEEVFLQRNKLVNRIFWFLTAISVTVVILQFSVTSLINAVGFIVLSLSIYIANKRQKFIKVIPYVLMIFMLAVSVGNVSSGLFFQIAMVGVVFMLIYPNYRLSLIYSCIVFTFVMVDAVNRGVLNGGNQLLLEASSSIIIPLFTLTAAVTVARLNQQLFFQAEERMEQAIASSTQVKRLFEEISKSAVLLAEFSTNLRNNVETTGKLTQEVTAGFGEVAKGMESQISSVVDISESVTEAEQNISIVADNAVEMNKLSVDMEIFTDQGHEHMDRLSGQILQVDNNIRELAEFMDKLNYQNKQIESMLARVTDIATQTNLLALNSAIEAARAGEHGRGFAVVSNEVKKLAENSRAAAADIGEVVRSISSSCQLLTEQIHQSRTAMDQSKNLALTSRELLEQIRLNTKNVVQQSSQVEDKTLLLRQSAGNIVEEITSISSVTQQSSASVEQILASMEEQQKMVDNIVISFQKLDGLITQLNLLTKEEQQAS